MAASGVFIWNIRFSPAPMVWHRRLFSPKTSSMVRPRRWCWAITFFLVIGLPEVLAAADSQTEGATVFGYHVSDPERYGVVAFDHEGRVKNIIEKPVIPISQLCGDGAVLLSTARPLNGQSRSNHRHAANWKLRPYWKHTCMMPNCASKN